MRTALAVVAALAVTATVAVAAPAVIERIDGPAAASTSADRRFSPPGDVVAVSNVGELDDAVRFATVEAARRAGAAAGASRSATIGFARIIRGGAVVQAAAPGWRYPFVVTSMERDALIGLAGFDLASQLGGDRVAMGRTTASLRGAQAGDRIEAFAADGSSRTLTVAVVAPDSQVGGTELLMANDTASGLGLTTDTRMVVWAIPDRAALDRELAAQGLTTRRETRVSRSWDPPRADSTLSTAETKVLLGEFAYQLTGTDSINQDGGWQSANLPSGRILLSGAIPIRARCHNRINADLQAALDEVAAAGLAGAIDVANANTYGGCHNPRFNRILGELGFLSRHAWGQALDTNTVSNCQGCVPRMDCRVVQIFRKHNFAWGGNFLRPDGMHFEWVGERRDLITTSDRYCSNVPGYRESTERVGTPVGDTRADLFGVDVLASDHDHDH
jgi:D-alanyl-D-alanine carboxypeptidase